MIYKINYELDNGWRFEQRCAIIITDREIGHEDDVREFLYKNKKTASCDLITQIYEIRKFEDSSNRVIIDFEESI